MIARMKSFLERLAVLYPDQVDHQHARSLVLIAWVMLGAMAILIVLTVLGAITQAPGLAWTNPLIVPLAIMAPTMILILVLVNQGMLQWARLLFVGVLLLLNAETFFSRGITAVRPGLVVLPIITAAMLFGIRGTLVTMIICALLSFAGWVLEQLAGVVQPAPYTPTMASSALVYSLLTIVMSSLLLIRLSDSLQTALAQSRRAANQLRTITGIAQAATENIQTGEFLPRLVEMIRERLSFYHVQVFLIDETGREARLVASTGIAGQQLLARGHRLPVGSRSVIGQVTQYGEVVYATDTSIDPIHRRNEFLPATRSELALPLRDGVKVIGALDVQSTRPNAFTPQDIEILQLMANQIAIIIRNAHLFAQTQANLEENRRLYAEAQANLREIERLNRQLTGQAWEGYFTGQSDVVTGVEITGTTLERTAGWTPTLAQAVRERQPIVRAGDAPDTSVIAVPIELRGYVLGALEVTVPGHLQQEDVLSLVEAVARRLTLSLDNVRLVEEAQTQARREQLINVIGGQLQSVNEVDEMLRVALMELQQALNADRAAIRLRAAAAKPGENGQEQAAAWTH